MRIWLITVGEPLPSDGPNERFLRTGILAQTLVDRGHEVVWWTSAFDHIRKTFRTQTSEQIYSVDGLEIVALKGCGYGRNVSVGRIRDHKMVAREFSRLALEMPQPDVIQASVPTVELGMAAVQYGARHKVPVTLDCRDMWPDLFVEPFPDSLQPLARLAIFPLFREAQHAFRMATGITGHTDAFMRWGLAYAQRPKGPWDKSFPFGYVSRVPNETDRIEAERFWDEHGVHANDSHFRACFVGVLSRQFEFEALAKSIRSSRGNSLQFVLCGQGEMEPMLREQLKGLTNVVFPGWVDAARIWVLQRRSHAGLAPYINTRNFRENLPNKVIEYLSAGLPILTSLREGEVPTILANEGVGESYQVDEPMALVETLLQWEANPELTARMRTHSQALFERKFRAETVYGEFAEYLEAMGKTGIL
ncbi:MAG: glycosyltransferase family 4 protein [Armatimonadetes bacterium]|nr:glycosyltransferase family 4 protein [Armatimonadota bacterium]